MLKTPQHTHRSVTFLLIAPRTDLLLPGPWLRAWKQVPQIQCGDHSCPPKDHRCLWVGGLAGSAPPGRPAPGCGPGNGSPAGGTLALFGAG